MAAQPHGLASGGSALWTAIADEHELDPAQLAQLEEACRAKDRLDKLNEILRGDADTWVSLVHRTRTKDYQVKIDAALSQANSTANLMKQLLSALRLPDAKTGKRPQYRGARGAYKTGAPDKVSSLERARAAKTG